MPVKVLKDEDVKDYLLQFESKVLNQNLTAAEISSVEKGTLKSRGLNDILSRTSKNAISDLFPFGQFIPEAEIEEMTKNYQALLTPTLTLNGNTIHFSNCCYFSLDEVNLLKSRSGLDTKNKPGLRFYFALEQPDKTKTEFFMTCILVPTETRPTLDPSGRNFVDAPNDFANEVSIATTVGAFNHGDLCPNACLGTDYA